MSSRRQLQDTAKERDVQNHLVKKHLAVGGKKLGQEARKLKSIDVTTSDEIALQDKLNRGRKVEAETKTSKDSTPVPGQVGT